jgi:hypothetical protein
VCIPTIRNSWPPRSPGSHPCNDGQRSARARGIGSQQHRSGDCCTSANRGATGPIRSSCFLHDCVQTGRLRGGSGCGHTLGISTKDVWGPSSSLACTDTRSGRSQSEPRERENKGPTIHITSSGTSTHTQAAKRIRPRSLSTAQLTPRRAAQWQRCTGYRFCMHDLLCSAAAHMFIKACGHHRVGTSCRPDNNNTAAANSLGTSTHVSPVAESV